MIFLDENKYIVFKRQTFHDQFQWYENLLERALEHEVKDAVVIRRQDKFASPCLLTYANMIGMVADMHPDKDKREELRSIADYFQEQGTLAGEEGWKLPTV